jgi:hypothetical protein
MSEVFQPMHDTLALLEGADRTVKLLTAEAVIENVMRNIDEDDLAADMLAQVLEILAVLIQRS